MNDIAVETTEATSSPKPRKTKQHIVVAPPPPPQSMLEVIFRASQNPRVDVEKMRALLDMKRQIERDEKEAEFNSSLRAAQAEMPKIVKDRSNDHTKSKYATLEAVSTKIDHIVRNHGMAMSFGTADSPLPGHYRIVCDLSHDNGFSRQYKVDLEADTVGPKGTGNKTPVQGVGSTMSYGRRYLKMMMFDLVIVGEDNDGNRTAVDVPSVPLLDQQEVEQLIELCDAVGCERDYFVGHMHKTRPKGQPDVKAFKDIAKNRFDFATAALRSYEAKHKGK